MRARTDGDAAWRRMNGERKCGSRTAPGVAQVVGRRNGSAGEDQRPRSEVRADERSVVWARRDGVEKSSRRRPGWERPQVSDARCSFMWTRSVLPRRGSVASARACRRVGWRMRRKSDSFRATRGSPTICRDYRAKLAAVKHLLHQDAQSTARQRRWRRIAWSKCLTSLVARSSPDTNGKRSSAS